MSDGTSDRQARKGTKGQEVKLHLDSEMGWSCWSLTVD